MKTGPLQTSSQEDAASPVQTASTWEGRLERKWWVLISVGIGTFMSALDTNVVNIVLPEVQQSFASSTADIQWVVIVYLLVVSGLLLSFGRLGDLYGHRRLYLGGFGVFIASSLLCTFSPTLPALVAFRGLQALGAAMLSANSPAILTKSFPAGQRGQALGLQATMTYLGLTVGPTLGGWLTDALGWRSVFTINLPVGLLALAFALRAVPHDQAKQGVERFDLTGAILFMSGLVALLLGLNQAHAWGWTSLPILGLLAAAVVLLAAFLWVERRVSNPMLDLSLFSNRVFSTSTVSAVFNYICVYSILFLMPFYLIEGRGFSTGEAGLLLSAMPIIMAVVAPISGTLSDRVGVRLPGMVGMFVLGLGLFLLARLGPAAPMSQVALALGVAGFGVGVFISPNNSALMGAAPRPRQGIAAGTLATARNVGMVLGVGLAGAVFTTTLSHWPAGSPAGLYVAVRASFLMAVVVAGLGLAAVATRGSQNKE